MGIEFIAGKRHFVKKSFDGGVAALATADLLMADEVPEDQSVMFDLREGAVVTEGEELTVQVSGETLVALRENIIATATNPPASLVKALRAAYGFTVGHVVSISKYAPVIHIAFRVERG